MNVNLKQIVPALSCIGVNTDLVAKAIDALQQMLSELDDVEVKGRQNVDTLLGCMMAIEAIIGKDGSNG